MDTYVIFVEGGGDQSIHLFINWVMRVWLVFNTNKWAIFSAWNVSARTILFLMRQWCMFCTKPTRSVEI